MKIFSAFLNSIKSSQGANNLPQVELEHAQSELDILEHDLQVAVRHLNAKCDWKHFWRQSKRPLFLVLGAETAGKSTFLVNSGLNLSYFNEQPYTNLLPTRYCQWCFAKEAIFIDAAGSYTTHTSSSAALNIAWRSFLRLLSRFKGELVFSGIVLVIDLPHMALDNQKLQEVLQNIRERIYELKRVYKKFPIYLVFSKMDLIYGFNEFFADLGLEDSSQLFGVDLENLAALRPAQIFSDQFKKLLKKLHERLIWRLNQERHEEKRFAIQSFPLELESLKGKIEAIINEIPSTESVPLTGVYFISSIRHGKVIDYLRRPLVESFALPEKEFISSEPVIKQPYFVKKLFEKILAGSSKQVTEKVESKPIGRGFKLVTIVGSLLIALSFIFAYKCNVKIVKQVATALQQPENTTTFLENRELSKAQDIRVLLHKYNLRLNLMRFVGFASAYDLSNAWDQRYQSLLKSQFIPKLEDDLSSFLVGGSSHKVQSLYSALKTYLMFAHKDHFNAMSIKRWFVTYWKKQFPGNIDQQARRLLDLDYILKSGTKITYNSSLVAKAKQMLSMMPKEGILYTLMLSKTKPQDFVLSKDGDSFFSNKIAIADIYTAKNFNQTYFTTLPKFVADVFGSDWVLAQLGTSTQSDSDLLASVRNLYVRSYARAWVNVLNSIQVMQFKSVPKAAVKLQALAGNDSPILNLLQVFKANTNINGAPKYFSETMSQSFKSLQSVDVKALQANLQDLANYLAELSQGNTERGAFVISSGIMQNAAQDNPIARLRKFASSAPEPLQSWLLAIADSSWQVILQSSRDYINAAWEKQVFPYYSQNLDGKYPLFKHGKADIKLQPFNSFFMANGVMDKFFVSFIKPFVNLDDVYWQWKNVYGRGLGFSQKSLEIFIRAALIQKMFYDGESKNPEVRFTLHGEVLGPDVQSLMLKLDNQTMIDTVGHFPQHVFTWRGEVNSSLVLEFMNINGKTSTLKLHGPWAWFKLLDRANLAVSSIKQRYHLIFDLNGNSAKYILDADKLVNPFIPGVINGFRCLKEL